MMMAWLKMVNSGDGKKWSDSGYILKGELIWSADVIWW